jgi:cytochrome P450
VEELLRYDGPTKVQTRVITETHVRADRELREGDVAFMCIAGANRDERAFPDPDRVDISRDTRHHIAFGLGGHHCLGAPLARLEGHLGLRTLFERCPDLEVTGDLSYEPRIASRSLTGLSVTVR